ncbi:MAG: restriction endonuclease subunit S [Hyphomicrobiaceae bacterium]|nr:MAG: restriction endonuclease subunit S [Hyphomicrobiaceae bacterium]
MIGHPSKQPSGLAWAPLVPAHWTVKKLAFLASLKSGDSITTDDIKEDGPYPVYGGNGLRGYTDRFTHDGEYALIGRQGALCGNINYAKGEFWASEHAVVVAPREEIAVRWLGELLRAMELNQYSVSAAQPGLSVETIAALRVPIPPVKEQRAIAAYLDRETARLDALVAAKERVLELLAEKRRALITRAVTRGLDPKMKRRDSGVPWLGEIPSHWETERARWLFLERDARSEAGDEELLTVSHLTGVTPRAEKNVNMFQAETNEGYKLCEPGDLVINTLWAWMGAMGIAPVRGIASPAYNVYEPGPRLTPAYIDALVRLPVFAQEVTRYSKGVWSSRLRLYPEGFFEVYLPVPPLAEQHAIVEHIASETAKLDAVRAATERTVALLTERRAALIAAAVTGQLDAGAAA